MPRSMFAILAYHRVAATTSPAMVAGHVRAGIVTSPQEFQADIVALSREATVLSLGAALALSNRGQLPRRSVVLTFDDGYCEHFHAVLERLSELGLPATFFLTGHNLDLSLGLRWLEWTYRLEDLASNQPTRRRLANAGALKERLKGMGFSARTELLTALSRSLRLSNRMRAETHARVFAEREAVLASRTFDCLTIGGHTVTHPCLSKLRSREKLQEIIGSRRQVAMVRASLDPPFAYPFGGVGAYDSECIKMVEDAGFSCACTSIAGYNSPETPRFELRRFDMCKHSLQEVLGGLN